MHVRIYGGATRTYAILDVSPATYDEIRAKLAEAGYDWSIHQDDGREVVDMHGIALRSEAPGPAGAGETKVAR